MAKQVVWVFGASAAGKATFINYVSQNKPPELMARLGWQDRSVVAEPYSLSLIGVVSFHDSKTRQRSKILSSAKSLSESNDVVLIKGQQVDIDYVRPQRLRSECPDCEHSIIFLDAGTRQTLQRMRRKPWWRDDITPADIETWRHSQLKTLGSLDGFSLQILKSSKRSSYETISGDDD